MRDNLFFERFYTLCRGRGISPNGLAKELGIPSGSITAWKQGSLPRGTTLNKLADYFEVSVDYLLATRPEMSNEDLKIALFGGDKPISDEMLQEVLNFAQFLKQKNN